MAIAILQNIVMKRRNAAAIVNWYVELYPFYALLHRVRRGAIGSSVTLLLKAGDGELYPFYALLYRVRRGAIGSSVTLVTLVTLVLSA